MNRFILNTDIQYFIDSNLKSNILNLVLKGIPFKVIDSAIIIEQIEAKIRCQKKLPTWYNSKNIYYPNKLNIEQTSSEITAAYKANLITGNSLIDLTGGFGVDSFYFSKQVKQVTHCEIDSKLSEITQYNFKVLKATNIVCLNENGIEAIKRLNQTFDWVFIDPSRRNDIKQKVFLLSHCLPNVKTYQSLFLKYAKHVMIKTSPLLDIKATLLDIEYVKEVHIIAVNNEVKELLWVLERNFTNEAIVKTINIGKTKNQTFNFVFNNESNSIAKYSLPLTYLYEPNSAILKAGAFNLTGCNLGIYKLHKHTHLYTSKTLIAFPGRRFIIHKKLPFHKKHFVKEGISKANITIRNFPLSVSGIRKKLKIKDGGTIYLFFTTNLNEEKIILVCSKINI